VATTVPAAPVVNESKLASLTKHTEPAPTAPTQSNQAAEPGTTKPAEAPAAPKAPVDLSKANDKLSGLLGGKK
jgi:hypothetical protein